MARKIKLLCLANSFKHRGRCVAGIDLDSGEWIRPVADTPHGELLPNHYILPGGQAPKVLDVVLIELEKPDPQPHQPENWLITGTRWHRAWARPALVERLLRAHLVNGPALLGDTQRRTPLRAANDSLALVEPEGLEWCIEQTRYNPKRPRAHFTLNNAFYDLPVTDPAWMPAFRALDYGLHGAGACGLRSGEKLLLTISLAEEFEFDGYCYKLVAGLVPVSR